MSRPVRITLLGQTFTLRTDESDAHIEAVAALVDQRLRDLQGKGVPNGHNLGLFAALTLAGDLLKCQQQRADQLAIVQTQIRDLEAALGATALPATAAVEPQS